MNDRKTCKMDPEQKAFEIALDVRKFEIDLYWKRTNYFWVLITAVFSGYFIAAKMASGDYELSVLFSSIGVVLSLAWYLANRDSKCWQENWEDQVSKYEKKFANSIFASASSRRKGKDKWLHLHKGYRYSVSKVNQIVSLFIAAIWVVLWFSSLRTWLIELCKPVPPVNSWPLGIPIILFLTICAVIALLYYGRGEWGEVKSEEE